jgi:hypothetical protein
MPKMAIERVSAETFAIRPTLRVPTSTHQALGPQSHANLINCVFHQQKLARFTFASLTCLAPQILNLKKTGLHAYPLHNSRGATFLDDSRC